jgi:hypothetical protein
MVAAGVSGALVTMVVVLATTTIAAMMNAAVAVLVDAAHFW